MFDRVGDLITYDGEELEGVAGAAGREEEARLIGVVGYDEVAGWSRK